MLSTMIGVQSDPCHCNAERAIQSKDEQQTLRGSDWGDLGGKACHLKSPPLCLPSSFASVRIALFRPRQMGNAQASETPDAALLPSATLLYMHPSSSIRSYSAHEHQAALSAGMTLSTAACRLCVRRLHD
jgi:hypothetical protein